MVQLSIRIGYCDFSCTTLAVSRYNAQRRFELLRLCEPASPKSACLKERREPRVNGWSYVASGKSGRNLIDAATI